jgi:hypothetical protein
MNKPECFCPWEIVKTSLKILRLRVRHCHLLHLVCSIRSTSYILERPEKYSSGTNRLAYFNQLSVLKKKSFITLTPGWDAL